MDGWGAYGRVEEFVDIVEEGGGGEFWVRLRPPARSWGRCVTRGGSVTVGRSVTGDGGSGRVCQL